MNNRKTNRATAKTKSKKKRRNDLKWIQLAETNGINKRTYINRVDRLGWTKKDAATIAARTRRKDTEWIELALKNGISKDVYLSRVDDLFWSPEEAATTPKMTRKEASVKANEIKEEYRKITNDRLFKDTRNMFKLTPQHIEIAAQNGLKETTVKARVINYGWTVQDAITTPIRENQWDKPKEYFKYLALAKENNIKEKTYRARVKSGWSLIDAATKKPSLSHPRRPDTKWIKLAEKNGISRNSYVSRINIGWTCEDAATTPILKKGEYLNEQTKENASKAFKKFREKR